MGLSHAIHVGITAVIIATALGCVGMFSLSGVLYFMARKYCDSSKKLMEETERKAAEAEKDLSAKTNRIAALEPDKLEQYLITGFARCLEFASAADVSDKDHNAIEKLYSAAWIRFIDPEKGYLTPETEAAIARFYGKEFISRTCFAWFFLANQRGLIRMLVKRETTSDQILQRYLK